MIVSSARRRHRPFLLALAFVLCWGAAEATWAKKGKKAKGRAELNGVVHGQEENPLPGASVRLTAPDGEVLLDAKADEEGAFSVKIPGPDGTYTLALDHPDYAAWETPLEFKPDEELNLTFKLIDTATANKQAAIKAFNQGAELVQAGSSAEAKAHFLEAAALDPQLAEAHLGLTDVYLGEEDLPNAAASIDRFRALRPTDIRGFRIGYEVYERLGDREKATPLLDGLRGSKFARSIAAQIYNQGVIAMQGGDETEARERFEASAALEPTLTEPLAGLATLAYNASDYPATAAALDRLHALEPEHPQGHRLRFLLHDAQAETEAAMAAFDAYHAVAPEPAVALLLERAELDFRDGNSDLAARALGRILELEADHAQAHYTMGLIHFQTDPAKARMHLGRFLELAPDDPEAGTAREMLQHL